MSGSTPTSACEQFDLQAEDLALGMVDEPMRARLLAHAATCPTCQSLLDGLGTVIDRLLLVAPQEEPPAGFESRALDRISTASVRAPHRLRLPLWVAGFIAVIVGASGFLLARQLDESPAATRAAVIVTPAGLRLGSVHLVDDPSPHVLVLIAAPRPEPGVRNCELQLGDGTWVNVGSWKLEDISRGVWAVGVDAALLRATAMRITTVDGKVLATATFS